MKQGGSIDDDGIENKSFTLYIKNLPFTLSVFNLEQIFEKFEVVSKEITSYKLKDPQNVILKMRTGEAVITLGN